MKNKTKILLPIIAGVSPVATVSFTTGCNLTQPSVSLPEVTEIYLNNSDAYPVYPTFKNFGSDLSYTLEVEDDEIFTLNEAKNMLVADEKYVQESWIQPHAGKAKKVTLTTKQHSLKAQTNAIIKGSIISENQYEFDVGKVVSVTAYPDSGIITFKATLNGTYEKLYGEKDRWFDFVDYIGGSTIAVTDGLKCNVYYDGVDITKKSVFANGVVKIYDAGEKGTPKFEKGKELRFEFDTTDWTLTKSGQMPDIGIRFHETE